MDCYSYGLSQKKMKKKKEKEERYFENILHHNFHHKITVYNLKRSSLYQPYPCWATFSIITIHW